jgi:hypothetical protein
MVLRRNSHGYSAPPLPPQPSAANATQDVGLYNTPYGDACYLEPKKIGRLRQRISLIDAAHRASTASIGF